MKKIDMFVFTLLQANFGNAPILEIPPLGKGSVEKSRELARKWGGGLPMPEFFGPFFTK